MREMAFHTPVIRVVSELYFLQYLLQGLFLAPVFYFEHADFWKKRLYLDI